MKTTLRAALFTALATVSPAFAAEPAMHRDAASIAAVERFDSGVLAVEKHGSRGRP